MVQLAWSTCMHSARQTWPMNTHQSPGKHGHGSLLLTQTRLLCSIFLVAKGSCTTWDRSKVGHSPVSLSDPCGEVRDPCLGLFGSQRAASARSVQLKGRDLKHDPRPVDGVHLGFLHHTARVGGCQGLGPMRVFQGRKAEGIV